MKKKALLLLLLILVVGSVSAGCSESDRVSSNISNEADNFNIHRRLTVINTFSDKVIFEMTGYLSIYEDGDQLEITVKNEDGNYKKHFAKINGFTTYVLEDTTGSDVSTSKYTLNFNPDMILPFDAKNYNEDGSQ